MSGWGRWLRGAAAGVLVAGFVGASAGAASAHAELEKTDPKVGQTLRSAPRDITFTFTESMLALGATVRVVGPGGAVERGKPAVRGRTVTQPLDAGVKNGSYIVTWRLTSRDGHAQDGTFTFLLAAPAQPTQPTQATQATQPAGEETPNPVATASPVAELTSSPISTTDQAMAAMDHDGEGSLPVGWVMLGFVVLALVIAGGVLTEVRRRRSATGVRGRPTD